jgi:hypothetical protein
MEQPALAIEIEFVMKSFKADAKKFCGPCLIVFGLLQGPHDHLPLYFLEWCANGKTQSVFVSESFSLFDWIRREVMAFDLFTGADYYGPLDNISQLTHVSGPRMELQGV